uniref:Uncharacterized protein n=1 Tax=Angiostrongylus cantonensis TaxID=6313 RepID=A0A0K0D8V2_ANGCA
MSGFTDLLIKDEPTSNSKEIPLVILRNKLLYYQLHDEMIRDILPQLWRRIESANTFEDLTKVQLINDLSTARSEAEHLQHRYESAEAARKALEEKYNIVLEEYHKTVSESPLYRLDLNTTRTYDDIKKSEADRRKERRGTMVPPIKSVLLEEKDQSDAQPQENDLDKIEERRKLIRLEIDNKIMFQISSETEAALNDIFNKQRRQ